MADTELFEDDDEASPGREPSVLRIAIGDEFSGRIDKVLAEQVPQLSRARLQALIEEGRVFRDGTRVVSGSARASPGVYRIDVPAPVAAEPEPEAIPLKVLFEDEHLIVVDKPAGMAVHPAPGSERGTLVNALLAHCAGTLSGVGGVARPGIVHRLDKDTSGVMVAAKTDRAHAGLADLFARRDLERSYVALTRGAPSPPKGSVETRIGRSPHDRKKMAVLKTGGRAAVTHYAVQRLFGPAERPYAARIACRLETGRTHQIRVHLAFKGCPCLGDPLYGSGRPALAVQAAIEASGLMRQALHAAVLGFVHPVTGEALRFETAPPEDMAELERRLGG
jgi:23S rRNA pseudouridine1911/1915/1917 synthase